MTRAALGHAARLRRPRPVSRPTSDAHDERRHHALGMGLRLAVVAAAVVVATCAGGARSDIEAPDGYVVGGIDGVVRFAHPTGWKEVPPSGTSDKLKLQIETPERRDGFPLTAIQVFHAPVKASADVRNVFDLVLADSEMNLPDFELIAQRDIQVKGATGAKVMEDTYSSTGTKVPLHSYDLIAVDGKGSTVSIVVVGTQVDPAVARRIIDSVQLET